MNIRITRFDPIAWGEAWKRVIAECETASGVSDLRAAWRKELKIIMRDLHR